MQGDKIMPLMFKCPKCRTYTLQEQCSKCGQSTESPQYKFKPKWSKTEMVASFEE